MLSKKRIVIGCSCAIAAVFLIYTPKAVETLGAIQNRQVTANERLIEWKNQYQALQPVKAAWTNSFISEADATDLLKLFRYANVERHGLSANVDKVRQSASSAVSVNGQQIGLQRLCLATAGDSFEVTAGGVTALRAGLRELAKRRDLVLGSIELSLDAASGIAKARIQPLCVLVRTGTDSNDGATAVKTGAAL